MSKQRYVMEPNLLTPFCNGVHQQIGLYVFPTESSEEITQIQEGIRTFCRISCLNTHFYTTVANSAFWFRIAQMLGIGNDGTEEEDTKAYWYRQVKNKFFFIRNVMKHTPRIRCTRILNSERNKKIVTCDDTGINTYFFKGKALVRCNELSKEEKYIGKKGDIDFRFVDGFGFLKNCTSVTDTKYIAIHEGNSICIASWDSGAYCQRIFLSDNASVISMQFDADTLIVLVKNAGTKKGVLFLYSIRDKKCGFVDLPSSLESYVLADRSIQIFIMSQYIVFIGKVGNGYLLDKKKRAFCQEFHVDNGFTSVACAENRIVVTYPFDHCPWSLWSHYCQVTCMHIKLNSVEKIKETRCSLNQWCEDDVRDPIDTCIFYTSLLFLMYSPGKLYVLLYDMQYLNFRKKIELPIEKDLGPNWGLVVTNNRVYVVSPQQANDFQDDSIVFTLDFTSEPIVPCAEKDRSPFSVLEDAITDGIETITEKFRSIWLTG